MSYDLRPFHECLKQHALGWPYEKDRCSYPACICLRKGQSRQGDYPAEFAAADDGKKEGK